MKSRRRFNFQTADHYLAFGALILFIVLLNCTCSRKVHDAETRSIPKVLMISTNIGEVTPGLPLSIRTRFESLPADWYCKHYGSGDGTKPWYIEDSNDIPNKNGPVSIPLVFRKKTFCPYVIDGIFIDLGLKKGLSEIWTNRRQVYFWSQNPEERLLIPASKDTVVLNFKHVGGGIEFAGDQMLNLGIPENIGDTIYLSILLRNDTDKGVQ